MPLQIRSRQDAQEFLASEAFRPLGYAPANGYMFFCGEPQEPPDTFLRLYRWPDGRFSVFRSGIIGGEPWADEKEEILRDAAGWVYARRKAVNEALRS